MELVAVFGLAQRIASPLTTGRKVKVDTDQLDSSQMMSSPILNAFELPLT